MNNSRSIALLLVCMMYVILGCKKDKPISSSTSKQNKFELIEGQYKVYDTTGVYLYDMSIEHISGIDSLGKNRDSLRFVNFDGQFDFKYWQSDGNIINLPKNYFYIGSHDPIKDKSGNRWKIMGFSDHKHNALINDTIHFWFSKNNIQYYIYDVTPYFGGMCYQTAVKQH